MKEIKAYIRDAMKDRVIDALQKIGRLTGFAVVPVHEFGYDLGSGRLERVEMVKLEIDAPDDLADEVVACIVRTARTGPGHHGDGRVMVLDLATALRVEDGATGDAALLPHDRGDGD